MNEAQARFKNRKMLRKNTNFAYFSKIQNGGAGSKNLFSNLRFCMPYFLECTPLFRTIAMKFFLKSKTIHPKLL